MLGALSLAIWNDIVTPYDDQFNEWHTREHMPERIGIPGFLRGRRYEAIDAAIRYFTLYELADESVLNGPHYKALLNAPTPWSVQSTAQFLNNYRGVCRVVHSRTLQAGGNAVLLRVDLGHEALPPSQVIDALARDVLRKPGVCGFHLMRCDRDLSGTQTTLQSSRKIALPDVAIMIDLYRAGSVTTITRESHELAEALWPGRPIIADSYRLQCEIIDEPCEDVLKTVASVSA